MQTFFVREGDGWKLRVNAWNLAQTVSYSPNRPLDAVSDRQP